MSNKKIKWAVLGTSYISEVMTKAIGESSTSELIAIASRNHEKAKNFALKFSIPKFYGNYEALLENKEIDVVYIGLPNHLHKEWIVRCALAGKHILCEKPLIISEAEVLAITSAIASNKVCCMEGLMYLHHPFIQTLKEIIENKLIGNVRLYHAAYTANIARLANPTAGGSIRNLGCYPVSLVRLLAQDEPVIIQGLGRLNSSGTSDNCSTVMLKFADESIAVISAADDLEMRWQFEVHGTKGYVKVLSNPWLPELTNNRVLIQLNDEDSPRELNIPAQQSLYSYQIDALNQQISYPSHSEIPLPFSLGNFNVLEAWRQQVFEAGPN